MKTTTKYDYLKRGLDIVCAGVGLVVLSPVIGTTALLVRAKLGSPVLFRQKRPGLHGQLFTLYKFRTMRIVDENDDVENDYRRITSLGRTLRSLSLDELPSLFNVLRGDMSIVGPRPLLEEYLDLYTPEQAQRHTVRPGITGLAQVKGRNDLPWEKKFDLDVKYVRHRSLRLDCQILWRTVIAVVSRDGVSKTGETTTDKFQGSDKQSSRISVDSD